MEKDYGNLCYVRMFQEITGIDASGNTRFSPVMLYRKDVGQELFDEIMQSRKGEKILKALIKTEAVFDDKRSSFNVFATEVIFPDDLSDSLKENLAPLVPRKTRSVGNVNDIEPLGPLAIDIPDDKVVICTKNFLEPMDSDDLAELLEEESLENVGLHVPGILTYSGMFYDREVKINVHYLQDEIESNNCDGILLKMLLEEAKVEMLEQVMKGVSRSDRTRENSSNFESLDSIDFTFDQKDERLYREYPVDTSEFITKNKLVFTDKNAKTLLWMRVVEFNKFIVSAMGLVDFENIFGYM